MWSLPAVAALICTCFVACLPEFDPDLGSGSVSAVEGPLCGVQGGPCCQPPAASCEPDLLCDPERQRCMRPPVLLCSSDAECASGEVCCSAGLLGTCERGPVERCPALDLMVATPELDLDAVDARFFDPSRDDDRCLIERGCVGGPGLRRLLGVSTLVSNVGPSDLLLGSPDAMLAATTTTCGGEPRFASFLRYELLDSSGTQARQDIAASCSPAASGQFVAPFDCDFQGIWSDFSQTYPSSLADDSSADDCRWLDITDLLPGQYTLRVTVNPSSRLPERNFENNTPAELPILIPAFDPTAPCPEPHNPLLGEFSERECGWVRAAFQSDAQTTPCTPGAEVLLSCGSDTSDFACGAYRMCDGPGPCSYEESIQPAFPSICLDSFQPNLFLTCPDSGQYSLWLPGDALDAFTCAPAPSSAFDAPPEPGPDAGAPNQP